MQVISKQSDWTGPTVSKKGISFNKGVEALEN